MGNIRLFLPLAVLTLLLPAGAVCYNGQGGVHAAAQSDFLYDYQWVNADTDKSPWGWENTAQGIYLFALSDGSSAYCADFSTAIEDGAVYRRVNPEDAVYFTEDTAALVRGIVTHGYRTDWTEEELKAAEQAAAEWGVWNLTRDEALAATQLAIWTACNTNAFVGGLSDGRHRLEFRSAGGSALPNNVRTFRNYLLHCDPIPLNGDDLLFNSEHFLSAVYAEAEGGEVTLYITPAGTISAEDELTLTAEIGGTSIEFPLDEPDWNNGFIFVIPNVCEDDIGEGVRLSLSGWQAVNGVCFYEPTTEGDPRGTSQNLIGWMEGLTEVSAALAEPVTIITVAEAEPMPEPEVVPESEEEAEPIPSEEPTVEHEPIPSEEPTVEHEPIPSKEPITESAPPLAEVPATGAPDVFWGVVAVSIILMLLLMGGGRRA